MSKKITPKKEDIGLSEEDKKILMEDQTLQLNKNLQESKKNPIKVKDSTREKAYELSSKALSKIKMEAGDSFSLNLNLKELEEEEEALKDYYNSEAYIKEAVLSEKEYNKAQNLLYKDWEQKYEQELKESIKKQKEVLKELKKNKGNFKRSGHLIDQTLKYDYPKDKTKQLSIFDSLGDETIKDIEYTGIERSQIFLGIKLTSSETKLVDSLCKLLHEKSQNLDPDKPNYYTGESQKIQKIGGQTTIMPNLCLTLYQLTKEYKSGGEVSGKDIENVKNILFELKDKNFLIKYTEQTTNKNTTIKKEIEMMRPLIYLDKATLTALEGDVELYKKTSTIISLNPIFRSQIDKKFILTPNDITKRTEIANGSHNIPEATIKLREYLMRELSSKRYKIEHGVEKLYYLLAEKKMKGSRIGEAKKSTERAIDTCIKLNLLKSYKIEQGIKGDPKYIFTINKDF